MLTLRNNGDAIQNAVLSVDGRNLKEFGDIGFSDVKTMAGNMRLQHQNRAGHRKLFLTYEF